MQHLTSSQCFDAQELHYYAIFFSEANVFFGVDLISEESFGALHCLVAAQLKNALYGLSLALACGHDQLLTTRLYFLLEKHLASPCKEYPRSFLTDKYKCGREEI